MQRKTKVPTRQGAFWKELPKYRGLLNYLANKSMGNYEDNVSVGLVAYGESANHFDFNRNSSKKSFIGQVVKNSLINSHRNDYREITILNTQIDEDEKMEQIDLIESKQANPEKIFEFRERLNTLSEDAQEIISIVLNSSAELWNIISLRYNHKQDKADLIEYIQEEYGWGYNRCRTAINEIKNII